MKTDKFMNEFVKGFLRGVFASIFLLSIIDVFVLVFFVFIFNMIVHSPIPPISRIVLGLLPLVLASFVTSKIVYDIIDLSIISGNVLTMVFTPDFFKKNLEGSLRKSCQAIHCCGDSSLFLYSFTSPEKLLWNYINAPWR